MTGHLFSIVTSGNSTIHVTMNTVFVSTKILVLSKDHNFQKIDRFIGGNLMKQKLTKDKGTRSQLKDVKSILYKRYK